jgi:quercetin dioxygenase-like cupin family protein
MQPGTENRPITEELSPGRKRQIIHLDKLMMVIFDFTDGPMDKPEAPHSHEHEQITYVAHGSVAFSRGTETVTLSEGDAISVPPGVPHCIQTRSEHVRLVDCFTPLREDFLKSGKR